MQFSVNIDDCPDLDASVYLGDSGRSCGYNKGSFVCDYWNLTQACVGPAATLGSEAMISVCQTLCDEVPGCTGSNLDTSYDVYSGLCTLHSGTIYLTKQCFHFGTSVTVSDVNECASGGTPKKKKSGKLNVKTLFDSVGRSPQLILIYLFNFVFKK